MRFATYAVKHWQERQELDAVLTHNIQGAADIGIPVRMLVDVISEKSSDFYKRFIHFCVNSKQVSVPSTLARCEVEVKVS